MKLVKKLLVVHADPIIRRRLHLSLADAGYDVRAFAAPGAALSCAQAEWFDLALVDQELPGTDGFAFLDELKKVQPTLPLVLLVAMLELPLIIRGIRFGLTDVIPVDRDPRPVLRRVDALLRPGQVTGADEELTPADLEAVERVLAQVEASDRDRAEDSRETQAIAALRDELLAAAKARADLETKLERAEHEKRALQAELRTLLAQNADQEKLQDELAALQTQRDMAARAQQAIDDKARKLADTRAEIAAERSALEAERARLAAATPSPVTRPASPAEHELAQERLRLAAIREDLREEEDRLQQEAARVRQETTQLARERRRWHEDLDLLQAREGNLRAYEARLRQLQADLEAEQLTARAQLPADTAAPAASPYRDDPQIRGAWEKLQRANELLEAERAMFRDERLALQDLQQTIHRRHDELRALERTLAEKESVRRALPQPAKTGEAAAPDQEERPSGLKTFTRAPFAIWGRGKDGVKQ